MKTLYFAGPYERREELFLRAWLLTKDMNSGLIVNASWLFGEHEHKGGTATHDEMQAWADIDLDEINASDALVLFTDSLSARGGCHVEFGYALALNKTVAIVGPVGNIFHCLPEVKRFDTWTEAQTWLVAWDRTPAEVFAPQYFIADEIRERRWTLAHLSDRSGIPYDLIVNLMFRDELGPDPAIPQGLARAFGTSADYWIKLDTAYREWREKQGAA